MTRLDDVLHAALGGLVAAGAMTAFRMGARRAGWLRATVPESVEQALAARVGARGRGSPGAHQAATLVVHLGYAVTIATALAPIAAAAIPSTVARGLALGGCAWMLSMCGLAPITRVTRPPWRASLTENLVDLSAHAVYGLVTALVRDELRGQARTGDLARAAAGSRVG